MIYYPLSTLMLAGIREILIITNEETVQFYKRLFKDGSHLGLAISYAIQGKPNGIAEALIIGKDFIGGDSVTLILGDNIFFGKMEFLRNAVRNNAHATVFGYFVNDPERYGVVEFDDRGKAITIEEKPQAPKSNYAVVGLYIYDNGVVDIAQKLQPSARGELEITDLNRVYLQDGKLDVKLFGRGIAWLDTGTPQALLDASTFIGAVEKRQGLKIGCIEEVAYMMNYITEHGLAGVIETLPTCEYKDYLRSVLINKEIYRKYQE